MNFATVLLEMSAFARLKDGFIMYTTLLDTLCFLFCNIHVGQNIEVLHKNHVYKGKVRFAGKLSCRKGDYVGVELNEPVGDTDGMFRGRRYFFVKRNHGIFTTADCIRFPSAPRYLYDRYHSVNPISSVDESLFQTPVSEQPEDPRKKTSEIDSQYEEYSYRLCETPDRPYSSLSLSYPSRRTRRFPLRHMVGNSVPAASMLRPLTSSRFPYKSTPIHAEYAQVDEEPFTPNSSMPDYVMPLSMLKRQMASGWAGVHAPKQHNHHRLRDSLHESWRESATF